MTGPKRRDVLKWGVGGLAVAPGLLDRALAIAPAGRTGTIMDVEHIIVLMQENRSFDHYFGMLNGVRGLGDPRPLQLPSGRSVWAQPSGEHADGYVLPYHGDSRLTRSFTVDGAEQAHQENIHILNQGRYDRWGHTGELHKRMLHYGPADLPFYYALADAFTVCDAYHASTMTQTYPNRLHLFTGCNGGGTVGGDPEMTNYGEDETPSADMATDQPLRPGAYGWTTYAERLQAAGVRWKVYQEYDNFGDNLLSVFPAFRPCAKASPLYQRGRAWVSEHLPDPDRKRSDGQQLVAAFRNDIATGQLPQISWIVTAADLSEHPNAEPAKGENLTAQLIAALIDHPQVFAKTALILNYDEAGGFFDHMPPPVPPVGAYSGHSTVSVAGEAKDWSAATAWAAQHGTHHPLGLGIRTPTIIVSPWTRGGHVCSQLFDHTSVLRFMEQRFGVAEPNISPWRRAVCGDLTSAFDFARPGPTPAPALPDTSQFRARVAQSLAGQLNTIPARQQPAQQMAGQRSHRPLPYRFAVQGAPQAPGSFALTMANSGTAGVCLTLHDHAHGAAPCHFTLGAGHSHTHTIACPDGSFALRLHGPNGYLRHYAGTTATPLAITAHDRPDIAALELRLTNPSAAPITIALAMAAPYAGPHPHGRPSTITVPAGATLREIWRLPPAQPWYDLTATTPAAPQFIRRFAGKVETGQLTRTDPGIGPMRL